MSSKPVSAQKIAKLRRLLAAGSIRQADELCRHLLGTSPSDFELLSLFSRICQLQGRLDEALASAKAASATRPRNVDARLRVAECLLLVGSVADALAAAEYIEQSAVATKRAGALRRVGAFYQRCSQPQSASRALQQALELDTDHPDTLLDAARLAHQLGHVQVAHAAIDRLIYLDPHHYEAWYLRSNLRRQGLQRNHIHEMVYAIEHTEDGERGRIPLYFALASELHDVGRFDDAAQVLKLGADLRAAELPYDVTKDEALFTSLAEGFPAPVTPHAGRQGDGPCPVLLVGLPLSGLEVLSEVLAQADACENLGATEMLPLALHKATAGAWLRGAWLDKLEQLDFAALAADYRTRTAALAPDARIVIDAQDLNFHYLGLVASALPEARIIHVHREPLDNALALYRTLFRGQAPYSYDLQTLGHYQRGYQQLMRHWQTVCGAQMLSVDYDLLLLEPARQLERIGAFLGLDEAAALADLLTPGKRPATLAGQRIGALLEAHPSGRWRRYENMLQPVAEALAGLPGMRS